jgi:cardiolipin synthase
MIALMHGARSRVVLTAPYVVPSEAFLGALCSAALRGVAVELIVDSASNKPLVQLAQESYYDEMLAAGVRILRRTGSFLHAKHMSVDDDIVLIGSSNLDIRSFVLNAEVSVLIADAGVAAALHRVQARYRAGSVPVTTAERAALSRGRRTLENLARLTDSVL